MSVRGIDVAISVITSDMLHLAIKQDQFREGRLAFV
jgi:hypothetical protein